METTLGTFKTSNCKRSIQNIFLIISIVSYLVLMNLSKIMKNMMKKENEKRPSHWEIASFNINLHLKIYSIMISFLISVNVPWLI